MKPNQNIDYRPIPMKGVSHFALPSSEAIKRRVRIGCRFSLLARNEPRNEETGVYQCVNSLPAGWYKAKRAAYDNGTL